MTDLHPSHVTSSGDDNVTGVDLAAACLCEDPVRCRCRCHRLPRRLIVSEPRVRYGIPPHRPQPRGVEPRTMLQAHPQTDPVRYEEPGLSRLVGSIILVLLVAALLVAIGVELGELPYE